MFHISANTKLLRLVLLGISLTALDISVSAQDISTVAAQPGASITVLDSTREQDGVIGPVRRVRTETVKLFNKSGKVVEGTRSLLETTTYSLEGNRVENAYYLAASHSSGNALMGKEEYKYDDKGNIIEVTLRAGDGSTLSKEIYTYEFDSIGNWTKMIASLAVFEAGKLSYEPIEATYRTITYYFNEAVSKVAAKPASSSPPASSTAPTSALNESAGKIAGDSSTGAKVGDERQSASSSARAATAPQPVARLVSSEAKVNRAIKLPKPVYPTFAKFTNASGKVSIEVTIDNEGKVVSARAVSGPRMFADAALRAARQALFSPTSAAKGATTSAIITYIFSPTP